jgi:PKD repeat protein
MNKLIKLGYGTALLASVALTGEAALGNGFTIGDLYLGFSQASAQSDYDIDLGQPSAIGVGGSTVVNLSGDFYPAVFNSVFTGGANGVVMAVVGGTNTFGEGAIYVTQVRSSNFGNAALPGSTLPKSNQSSATLVAAANEIGAILTDGTVLLPTAGSYLTNYVVDPTKSYTGIVDTTGQQNNFIGKSGIVPTGTISNTIVMDLWRQVGGVKTNNYLGYFTFGLSGTSPNFTFTPVAAVSPIPAAGFTGSPTTGATPLTAVFTDASTGNITNWIWNFGNGISVTNKSDVTVSNTYSSSGSYTVSLTVVGQGVTNTLTRTSYIVVTGGAVPTFTSSTFSGGKLAISGTNGSPGAQFRILTSTNLAAGTWTPVYTNVIQSNGSFGYTNSVATTNKGAFFELVSP